MIDELLIVPEGEPTAPVHLSEDGTACFDMIVGSMPPNLYAAVDTFALTAFAEAWSIHKRASLALQGQPLVLTSVNGQQYPNPLVSIINGQARLMVTLGARLGLDPVARMGLKVPDEKPPSKFDGLLGRDTEGWRRLN